MNNASSVQMKDIFQGEPPALLQGKDGSLKLTNGSRVAVVGGGPAGSFFAYFFLEMARRIGLEARVDIYEPRDYSRPGPAGCNRCGGIISESLVQMLATEGINLPGTVVQRGIESYKMHISGERSIYIDPPLHEKRIAAVHRGAGPLGIKEFKWRSFDGYLQELAVKKGARLIQKKVDSIDFGGERPLLGTKDGSTESYDLLAIAVGVNSTMKFLEGKLPNYKPPKTSATYISELLLGLENVETYIGNSMHIFLLDVPRLEFAALIPKGDYVTLCLLGEDIDSETVKLFLNSPEVKECLPQGWSVPEKLCHCAPHINIMGAAQPYADRVVFIGDSGASRLYKDGMGAAYRTAKAAATTAVFEGVSRNDFHRHYWPACRKINTDNKIGQALFTINNMLQKSAFTRRAVLNMLAREQLKDGKNRPMSQALWDMFTGSASYGNIMLRSLHPSFWGNYFLNMIYPAPAVNGDRKMEVKAVTANNFLGKLYQDKDVIIRQGESSDCMYVIQSGQVEVLNTGKSGDEFLLATLKEGDIFGEMALLGDGIRSATVRAVGELRVLTVDKKTLIRRIHEDPSLAFRMLLNMSNRIKDLDAKLEQAQSVK